MVGSFQRLIIYYGSENEGNRLGKIRYDDEYFNNI